MRTKVTKSSKSGRGGGGDRTASSAVVYDFADDDLDGEVLRPDGANVRARDTAGPMVEAPSELPVPEPIGVADEDGRPDAPLGGELEALPAPEVTASALSVVIPAAGQAVRYEQLLIDANQTQTIIIDARRRLRPSAR